MRFLYIMGETVQSQGAMYKAVAQPVLLYGSDIWMVTGEMIKVLTAFHHQAACQITELTDKRGSGGEWKYPEVEEVMESARIYPTVVYIKNLQTTIAERVSIWCHAWIEGEAERIPRTNRRVCWWDQDVVNKMEE